MRSNLGASLDDKHIQRCDPLRLGGDVKLLNIPLAGRQASRSSGFTYLPVRGFLHSLSVFSQRILYNRSRRRNILSKIFATFRQQFGHSSDIMYKFFYVDCALLFKCL